VGSGGASDLKPAEEDVQVRRVGTEAPLSPDGVHPAEPSEKEEEVAWADTLVGEVRLGRGHLAERRSPARRPRQGFRVEIRVNVRAVGCPDSSVRERGDKVP